MDTEQLNNIGFIGAGYVGAITSIFIAAKTIGKRHVYVTDLDDKKIETFLSGKLPIFEPGLYELFNQTINKNLHFIYHADCDELLQKCGIIFLTLPTYPKKRGFGAGMATDLTAIKQNATWIAKNATSPKIIVTKSTVSADTGSAVRDILDSNSKVKHHVVFNPEFLAEGSAINDLGTRCAVVGADSQEIAQKVADIYRLWLPENRIHIMGIPDAILAKLANNAKLAQQINSINTFQGICEIEGGKIDDVAKVIGSDERQGRFNRSGRAFGGSCFEKDLANLIHYCGFRNLKEEAQYWAKELDFNLFMRRKLFNTLLKHMHNTIAGETIAVYGYTFKPDTDDHRNSPAENFINLCLEEGAKVRIHDPRAIPNLKKYYEGVSGIELFEDPYEAAKGASALVIHTDWPQYLDRHGQNSEEGIDYEKVKAIMAGRLIVDPWRLLKPNKQLIFDLGFNLVFFGEKALLH